jgi:hypothetical protein
MGWGGARPGAGRKPKSQGLAVLHGAKRTRSARRRGRVDLAPPAEPVATIEPPADLTPAELVVWHALAPHALAAKTLVPRTAYRFRLLCQAEALRAQLRAQIDADGLIGARVSTAMDESGGGEQVFEQKAHPLIAKLQVQERFVAAGMVAFMLAPMGKEIEAGERPKDEWEEFDGPQLVKGA